MTALIDKSTLIPNFPQNSRTWAPPDFRAARVCVLKVDSDPNSAYTDNPFMDEAISRLVFRFATAKDFEGMEAVYREWFTPQVSIDDAEARLMLTRGTFVRMIEAFYSSESSEFRRLIG